MLYETLFQPQLLFWLCLAGTACGFLFDFKILLMSFLKKKVFGHILDFVITLFIGGVLFLLILNLWYGEMRLWHILVFVASLLLQQASLSKLLAKTITVCYNSLSKKIRK